MTDTLYVIERLSCFANPDKVLEVGFFNTEVAEVAREAISQIDALLKEREGLREALKEARAYVECFDMLPEGNGALLLKIDTALSSPAVGDER